MGGDEVLCGLTGPVDQWVEFKEIALHVSGHQADLATAGRLVGAQPGNPSLRTCERPLEWLDFSHVATGDARLLGMIETVDTLSRDELFKRRVPRIDRPDAAALRTVGLFPGRIGSRKQPAGVERHDIDIEPGFADVMQDDLILQPKTGGEDDRSIQFTTDTGKPLG